jgi:NAD(P)-dependent dehydrogenase (short-subunit alcohol dehydrogenase family)
MSDSGRLFGVRAMLCGGANGIGEAIARTLARHDASVVALDRADSDIETRYRDVSGVTGLAARFDGAENAAVAVATVEKELGGLDAIVISTGLQVQPPLQDADAHSALLQGRLASIRQLFDAATPRMKRSPAGRFIVVGMLRSAYGREAERMVNEAEAALSELVRQLAVRAGPLGVTVNYVQPGALMTPESRRVFGDDKTLRDYCIQRSAARRLGEALDIAKVVLFLASDDATFVSGSGIAVDGGRAA